MAATNIINCTNKGCYSQDFHKLDLESNEVICGDCGQVVEVSPYMKKIMKDSGQVFRKAKTTKEALCKACNMSDVPVLLDYGDDLFEAACKHCGAVNQHLTNYFIEPLKMNDQVDRIKVTVVEGEDTGEPEVLKEDGGLLPWDDPDTPPPQDPKVKEAEERERERALRKAAQLQRKQRAEELEAAAAAAAAEAFEEVRPAKVPGAARRARPASANDMLKRAGVKVLDDGFDEPDPEPRRIIKSAPRKTPGPVTAAEMLERAGIPLATPEDGEEDYAE
jgi:hypothetical protein